MSATSLLLTTLFAQSAISMAITPSTDNHVNVGYQELSNGDPAAAVEVIEGNSKLESDDPAALINLGTAYARMGQTEKALSYYKAAIESDVRYELELADGRWMDSRRAAKIAARALMKDASLAQR